MFPRAAANLKPAKEGRTRRLPMRRPTADTADWNGLTTQLRDFVRESEEPPQQIYAQWPRSERTSVIFWSAALESLTRYVNSRHQRLLSKRRQRSVRLFVYASLFIVACAVGLAHSQTSEQPLTLEAAADRKSDLQDQLKKLDESGLSDDELEAARIQVGELLTALSTFEEAAHRRDTFWSQLQSLPQRLEDALAARTELESRRPSPLPEITEALRADYEARRQFLEAEVNDLTAQTTSGGVRLARLPGEIQEARGSLDKLLAERHSSDAPPDLDSSQVSQAELLDARMQGQRANLEGLEAERQWLIERGPLHDALLHVARLRLKHLQEDLHKIQTSLGATIQAQRASSGERLEQLKVTLDASTSPAAKIYLQVRLDTERTRQRTADYQRQLNGLRKEVHLQENLNNQVRQDASRLLSLAEQYGSGEQVAQRLLLKFEHLRRERNRLTDNLVESLQSRFFLLPSQTRARPLDVLELRMRNLNDALFAVDDRLYEFDRFAGGRENQLTAALFSASPSELVGAHASLRDDLDVQRTALREQQQVLADLTQTMSALIALRQEHARLLDEGYQLALSRMLWLKDRAALSWTIFGDLTRDGLSLASRSATAIRSDLSDLWQHMKGSVAPWGLVALLLVVLPLAARRTCRRLNRTLQVALAASVRNEEPPGAGALLLLVLLSAVWPVYLAALGWTRQLLVTHDSGHAAVTAALVSGLYLFAAILGIGLFSQSLFRTGGWGQRFYGLDDTASMFLRRTLGIGCLAAILFLVPRQVVIGASPEEFLAGSSHTLERLLILAFQAVVFGLALRAGRLGSPLMTRVLAHSRDQDGILWRIWPFLHAGLLVALAGVMALNVLGYSYAARFIWLHGLETLSIILGSRLVLLFLLVYGAQRLVHAIYGPGGRWHDPARQRAANRSVSAFRFVSQLLLSVIALLLILELWGVSVWSVLNSHLGAQIMTRGFVVLVTAAIVLSVIQGSNVLAEYILRPRLTAQGETRELGRKLRTLTPLVQTVLKAVVLFIAALVLLEQINIRTGPLLAGLGLFGIAVGLASQSLIKDVINGLFILFEDSISVGDIVTVRGISGTVEKITLRVVVLRDFEGDVHVVPNSTIDLVTNKTKVYSRYLLDVGVAYREDVDTVMEILREVDADMRRDMRFGYNMLEPIEISGLDRFADSAVYVRARLKTRPGKQWEVGREFNRRLKKVFDERGIQIPFPHRTLYWGEQRAASQPSSLPPASDPDG